VIERWRYDDMHAVVSGGASGMGEATVRLLTELGAEITILDVAEPADKSEGRFIRVDLREQALIERAVGQLTEPVHALFNCAGLPHGPGWPPLETVLVNFIGLRHLTNRVIPMMPPGSAIASIATLLNGWWDPAPEVLEMVSLTDFDESRRFVAEHPEAVGDGYRFSKQCLNAWTLRHVVELGAKGIRANCIGPGPTATPLMPQFERNAGKERWDRLPRPLGRNSTSEEQAHAIVFLNSRAASIMTGSMVQTDGGMLAAILSGQQAQAVAASGYESRSG
jgi:NAD(P)-dependent dehydrogenase (short-subunit alcohol dehydrogenase family)